MSSPYSKQRFQDRFTQQWAIFWGKKIDLDKHTWLKGPFGKTSGIGREFITQLAEEENLIIQNANKKNGILSSFEVLNLNNRERNNLSNEIIDFYENTSEYDLRLSVRWNPLMKVFGILVNALFSNRINQLNIPTKSISDTESINSEIIHLFDPNKNVVKYTVWLRSLKASTQVIYLGVYGTCTLPSGVTCIKTIFPLPNGNATVIMTPKVDETGSLILDSSGQKIGESGFYFLLSDKTGANWTQYIRSFRDKLILKVENNRLTAEQIITLWKFKVLKLNYTITRKT